jgi:hypothetical protein
MTLSNRKFLRPGVLWLTLNLALISVYHYICININISNFTYPVICFFLSPKMSSRTPGVSVPHVEDCWTEAMLSCPDGNLRGFLRLFGSRRLELPVEPTSLHLETLQIKLTADAANAPCF